MKNKLFLISLAILLISFTTASQISLGTFEQGEEVLLIQLCADCSYINITSITYPNSSEIMSNIPMSQDGSKFTYLLDGNYTQTLGNYNVNGLGDEGGINKVWAYTFEITSNGRNSPDGIIVVVFSIIFIFLIFYLIFFLFYGLGHIKEWDLDIKDLAYNLGGYFALFAVFMLEKIYLGNQEIEEFLILFITIGAFTNFLLPIIGFVVSYFKQNTTKGDKN